MCSWLMPGHTDGLIPMCSASSSGRLRTRWRRGKQMDEYAEFLHAKSQLGGLHGFDPVWMPDFLFPFQQSLLTWAILKGRAAMFADCGLGKTPMQLVWAENVVRRTNRPVLVLTPLAVAAQTLREAEKFGIEAARSAGGAPSGKIMVTNYEKLHHFDPDDFAGVVCDESSAIKMFSGERQKAVTQFMRKMPFRLLCTATAAPNDYIELGTSAEALGELGRMDMLARFFKNDENSLHPIWWGARWRLKKHGEMAFWRWVCSWARAVRKPSDLGFDNEGFALPPLTVNEHIVHNNAAFHGQLFPVQAVTLQEQREERRVTLKDRCESVRRLVMDHDMSMIWCHLNTEGDELAKIIPNAIQVGGSDTDEFKEKAVEWFTGRLCVCDDAMFALKLASWQKDLKTIGSDITKNTENNDYQPPTNMGVPTLMSESPTTLNTTKKTRRNGKGEPLSKPRKFLPEDEKNTPLILNTERKYQIRSRRNASSIPKQDGPTISKDSEFPSTITILCSQDKGVDVPYVGCLIWEIEEINDTTSIIVMPQAASEDCCAANAILALDCSKTTQNSSNEPQCICGHQSGIRRLISKPQMLGLGLNLQMCQHMTVFPSHSFEQYYQGVRRCWRFGQKFPVTVDIITTEGEMGVLKNLQRKSDAADAMFDILVTEMNNAIRIERNERKTGEMELPAWL